MRYPPGLRDAPQLAQPGKLHVLRQVREHAQAGHEVEHPVLVRQRGQVGRDRERSETPVVRRQPGDRLGVDVRPVEVGRRQQRLQGADDPAAAAAEIEDRRKVRQPLSGGRERRAEILADRIAALDEPGNVAADDPDLQMLRRRRRPRPLVPPDGRPLLEGRVRFLHLSDERLEEAVGDLGGSARRGLLGRGAGEGANAFLPVLLDRLRGVGRKALHRRVRGL